MPIEIRMPALSPTMTEGNLARWLKKEGDEVHAGDVIAEIETDKATMEYEAADEGRIGKIIVPEGAQGIKVNQPIALLLEEGEDPATLEKFAVAAKDVGEALCIGLQKIHAALLNRDLPGVPQRRREQYQSGDAERDVAERQRHRGRAHHASHPRSPCSRHCGRCAAAAARTRRQFFAATC